MAQYLYTTARGKTFERTYPVGRNPYTIRVKVNGHTRLAYLDLAATHRKGQPHRNVQGKWPILSDAMAVHPSQIPEAQEFDRQHGVPTNYLPDGRPELRDVSHRRAYLKAHQMIDRSGYD
jgi:hypothetical protein